MTTLVLTNFINQGSASADSLKFVRVDSTQAIKKDATFTRKAAVFNPKTAIYSVPEYRFVFRSDVPDSEGNPTGQRISCDFAIRLPVRATSDQLQEQIVSVKELINSDDFVNAVIGQLFPCEGTCSAVTG